MGWSGSKRQNKLVWRIGNWKTHSSEKIEQKIAKKLRELRRTCCEETDRARQARIDELSMHQERNPKTASQLLTQIRDLQNKVNSLSDGREFYDPETASSSGATHVPSQPLTIPNPTTMPCRDSGLLHDTWNIMGNSGKVFQRLPARQGLPWALFEHSKKLASSSYGLRPDIAENTSVPGREMRREPHNSSMPVPRFQCTSRLKCVLYQQILMSLCTGSKKLR